MLLRMNLTRLLTSLRHRSDDIARRRSRYHLRGCRFHQPLITYCYCKYPNLWTNHNLASTTFSRNPRAQIRESQTMGSIDEEKEEERKDGFLVDAQETILMLMRIAIVTSIIITLLTAYLIMRMTHASSFPIILRKGSLV